MRPNCYKQPGYQPKSPKEQSKLNYQKTTIQTKEETITQFKLKFMEEKLSYHSNQDNVDIPDLKKSLSYYDATLKNYQLSKTVVCSLVNEKKTNTKPYQFLSKSTFKGIFLFCNSTN